MFSNVSEKIKPQVTFIEKPQFRIIILYKNKSWNLSHTSSVKVVRGSNMKLFYFSSPFKRTIKINFFFLNIANDKLKTNLFFEKQNCWILRFYCVQIISEGGGDICWSIFFSYKSLENSENHNLKFHKSPRRKKVNSINCKNCKNSNLSRE